MRQVNIMKFEVQEIDGKKKSVKVLSKVGLFHGWGQEGNNEEGYLPVAIVELGNGEVETVYAPLIEFTSGPVPA